MKNNMLDAVVFYFFPSFTDEKMLKNPLYFNGDDPFTIFL